MTKITLDAEAFKVLASDTRLAILRSLDARPKTVSELGRELDLNKATVHEHLQQLVKGDLIKKKEREGRKWVYYTLTWKGTSLLHPENTTVLVLLSLGLVGSTAAVLQLGNWLRWWAIGALTESTNDERGADESGEFENYGAPEESAEPGASQPANDTAGAQESLRADVPEEPPSGDGAGHWYDFLADGDFWIFAVLALVGLATLIAATVIKDKAVRRFRAGADARAAQRASEGAS